MSSSELVRNPLQLATAAARMQARDDSTDSPAPTPDDERKDVEAALHKFNEESDSSEEEEEEQHVHHTPREKLHHFLESTTVVLIVVGLVIVDCLILAVQLMIDLDAIRHVPHSAVEVLHVSSIVILSVFVVEVLLKMFAMGFGWLRSPWEVFDGTIVIVSFGLDISASSSDPASGASLLILLRLWRVARIIHGFVHAAQVKAEKRVNKYKRRLAKLTVQYKRLERHHSRAVAEIRRLGGKVPHSKRDRQPQPPAGESGANRSSSPAAASPAVARTAGSQASGGGGRSSSAPVQV